MTTAEGRDWRKELDKLFLYYRISPHCTTGKSPAKLLFEREIKTKLPEINQKIKENADKQRHANEHDIQVGDIVLVEQPNQNKLTTRFNNEPWDAMEVKGNAVKLRRNNLYILQSVERLRRIKNTKQHYNYKEVSDIEELTDNNDNRSQNKHIDMHSQTEDESRQLANGRTTETKGRQQRERRKPDRYRNDQFVTNIDLRGRSCLYSDTDELLIS
ncbi:hypothetical protein GJ496_009604 [Pomphorhynchus laevis]|nr:hypothetical protein GJ496_009604 [Pomphorhynchus laevis]